MVSLASPQDILKWSNGVVENAETINYRTGKPKLQWLFCEAIFGPVKPFECSCGKYKGMRYKGIICDRCGVEVTSNRVRRERMWHIELAAPVVHIWYYKATPSRIWLLLNLSTTDIEKILYFVKYVVTAEIDDAILQRTLKQIEWQFTDKLKELDVIFQEELLSAQANEWVSSVSNMSEAEIKKATDENKLSLEREFARLKALATTLKTWATILESDYRNYFHRFDGVFQFKSWSESLYDLLCKIDIQTQIKTTIARFKTLKWEERKKTFKVIKLLINLFVSDQRPEWMVIRNLPVIPPDLRPVVQLDGWRFASSDVNQFYRRVVQRNLRLKKMIQVGMPDVVKKNEIRLLQESVNNLLVWDKNAAKTPWAKVFRSLTDMLSGKEWLFRRNLLWKRVDYSWRSVITSDPRLKLDECGLPLYVAVRIFTPFIIAKLIERNIAYTPKQAEKLIKEQNPVALEILQEVIQWKFVLLNRPPTLHRLSIQAFRVKLMPWKTIRIHPLVCPAFNADFDGDQMAVHLPLSDEAQYEAENIVASTLNTLKPSSWEPVISHTQDMILGAYYLTQHAAPDAQPMWYFDSIEHVLEHHQMSHITIHQLVKLQFGDETITTTVWRVIFNSTLPYNLQFINQWWVNTQSRINKSQLKRILDRIYDENGAKEVVRVADAIKEIWFTWATQSCISSSIFDILIPDQKWAIVARGEEQTKVIQDNLYKGFYSEDEKSRLTVSVWYSCLNEMEDIIKKSYTDQPDNDFYMFYDSWARWSLSNLNQLSWLKWLVVSPSGKVIELPLKSSYVEWYNPLEYFISAHGARKGRADTALKTADAWYLTRRLCDSTQSVIVKEHDCGTTWYIVAHKYEIESRDQSFASYLYGRILAKDVIDELWNVLATAQTFVDKPLAELIVNAGLDSIAVRSPLVCNTISWVCQQCFGMDLASRKIVDMWVPVGIIASQSIWEPGTQLTMNTRHKWWVASAAWDITWGMERLNELLEVRTPARKAIICPFDGTIRLSQDGKQSVIEIIGTSDKKNYFSKPGYKILVKVGDILKKWANFASKGSSKLKVKEDGEVLSVVDGVVVLGVVNLIKKNVSPSTVIKVKDDERVLRGQILTSGTLDIKELWAVMGDLAAQQYIVNEMKVVYSSQWQEVNDKYMEIVVKQMFSKIFVEDAWDTSFVPWSTVNYEEYLRVNIMMELHDKQQASWTRMVQWLTQTAKEGEWFLAAASFQETVRVMVDNSLKWAIDELSDLKSNVILGRLLPIGSNFSTNDSGLMEAMRYS